MRLGDFQKSPCQPLTISGERQWVLDLKEGKLIPLGVYQRRIKEEVKENEID